MPFRLDINGLRFFAVMLVVLFHFKLNFFSGGFIGVDMFFVISGYLMSEICIKSRGEEGWVLNFYKKRFQRIYPALIAMIFISFLVILVTEPPSGLVSSVKQGLSGATFLSNIYYWKETGGYFSGVAETYWFLHTWSLSLEWQFYLAFPILIYFVSRFLLDKYLTIIYFLMFLASFTVCLVIAKNHQDAAFYLLPTRAWELFLGAIASTVKIENKFPKFTEIVAVFAIIVFSLVVREGEGWPGFLTLIPTLSVAAIIHASVSNKDTILKYKAMQVIGSASYSIYLFHWPVVAFIANNNYGFSPKVQFIGVMVSMILGFISYKYIENWNKKKTAKLLSFSAIFLVASSFSANMGVSKHWTSERVMKLDQYQAYSDSEEMNKQFGSYEHVCSLSSKENGFSLFDKKNCMSIDPHKKNLLLIGDSHAAELSLSMREIIKDYNILQATSSGCMPYPGSKGEKRCKDLVDYVFNDFLVNNRVDTVIISASWVNGKNEELIKGINNAVRLAKQSADKVFVIGQTKTFDIDFYRIAQKNTQDGLEKYQAKESFLINDLLKSELPKNGVHYIDVYDVGCVQGVCSLVNDNGVPYMFDTNHLTKEWADVFVRHIKDQAGI